MPLRSFSLILSSEKKASRSDYLFLTENSEDYALASLLEDSSDSSLSEMTSRSSLVVIFLNDFFSLVGDGEFPFDEESI